MFLTALVLGRNIERERERERDIYIYMYMHIYIYIYIRKRSALSFFQKLAFSHVGTNACRQAECSNSAPLQVACRQGKPTIAL